MPIQQFVRHSVNIQVNVPALETKYVVSLSGGPLFDGDIEDYNGRCHVMCPWHSYMFDLETGQNEIGLRVRTNQ